MWYIPLSDALMMTIISWSLLDTSAANLYLLLVNLHVCLNAAPQQWAVAMEVIQSTVQRRLTDPWRLLLSYKWGLRLILFPPVMVPMVVLFYVSILQVMQSWLIILHPFLTAAVAARVALPLHWNLCEHCWLEPTSWICYHQVTYMRPKYYNSSCSFFVPKNDENKVMKW